MVIALHFISTIKHNRSKHNHNTENFKTLIWREEHRVAQNQMYKKKNKAVIAM